LMITFKVADLIVVNGNPPEHVANARNVELRGAREVE
jgi:imidazolonepropionase-like amidohydrolase